MRADRLVAIVLLLQARGAMSAPQLAAELEVSTRTVYRDVEALGAAGVPVYAERGAQGGIRLLEGYRTDLTGLNAGEAEALLLMGIPGPVGRLGLGQRSDAARRKVLAALPRQGREAAEAVRQKVFVDPDGWEAVPLLPHLVAVAEAVWSERRIRIDYVRADNAKVTRTVDPLGLVLKAGTWYLIGSLGQWEVTFRVERIRAVEVLERPAHRPCGFDLAAHWASVVAEVRDERLPVTVRLAVERSIAGELPRRLGEAVRDQVVDALAADGSRIVVDVGFRSDADAVAAVLSLGSAAEILSPPALRSRAAAEAAAVAAVHQADRSPCAAVGSGPERPVGDGRGWVDRAGSRPREPEESVLQASRMFEPETAEVIAARHFVLEVLHEWGIPDGDVSLLVSELATNAVLHARSEFTVTVQAGGGRVRVGVSDRNSRMPQMAVVPPDAYSGRGLMLVQALASSWGVDAHDNNGKTIWFEMEP
ncbi:WYL domain-containing protein [Acidiferrimicrobium sp. IK]|uniref:WYL domain-containing protein n=1 Tax=Acidiferrimicrobium sp. IK TaxID=2871700 RepID=UPI0021CB0C1F|nr:WYL domain-containing protein [Acidiferrimicrobium sp. IK]MCU4185416.1 WYL domain-containing protein [Acidiferrimicrobium sp. IK]